uniref:Rad60-SLD domain-containing protein n=1 Tax=Caenorhabditis tropicalis TaxID=1561998 RepID=A0A1I7T535_9PELO
MQIEIDGIKKSPLQVTINGTCHQVVVELYQSILDMDAYSIYQRSAFAKHTHSHPRGRATNSYTTRATLSMASRFLGSATVACFSATRKANCPVGFPMTMRAEKEFSDECVHMDDDDCDRITEAENDFLSAIGLRVQKFR